MNVQSTMSASPTDADGGAGALAAASAMTPRSTRQSHANVAEIVPSLPLETRCPPYPLRLYSGFWMPEVILRTGLPAVHTCFQPRSTDIILASYPKSGTTWLKALAFATLNRATHSPSDGAHPLCHSNPHDCVKFLEQSSVLTDDDNHYMDALEALPSPRVLSTHLPYSLLPEHVTGDSGCRLVYICRDPKDTLVSLWFFTKKMASTMGVDSQSFTFEEACELFCEGRCVGGPQWSHVLEYWEESQRRPGNVLFLMYEEMLREPVSNLKKLAQFMGCAFSEEEEEAGVVHAIVGLCSLDKLKNLEVNKNGTREHGLKNEAFFRKGVTGDWRNHMTFEMATRLSKIVEDATQGSGFTFANSM